MTTFDWILAWIAAACIAGPLIGRGIGKMAGEEFDRFDRDGCDQ